MAKKINVDGNFKKKLGKTVNKAKKQSKVIAKDVAAKSKLGYGRYVAPTVGLFKSAGKLATNVGKLALRAPGISLIGLPLAFTGAKALGKKYGRGYNYSSVRQFDKKGRKFI
jgi:hypothetical protein